MSEYLPTLQPMSVSQTAPGYIEIRHGGPGAPRRCITLSVPADPTAPAAIIDQQHTSADPAPTEPATQERRRRRRRARRGPCRGCPPPPPPPPPTIAESMTTGGSTPETLLRSIALPQLALHSARQMACATCDQPRRWPLGLLTWCGRPWILKPLGRDPARDGCGCLLPLKLMFARCRPHHPRARCPLGRWPRPRGRQQTESENVSGLFQPAPPVGKDATDDARRV